MFPEELELLLQEIGTQGFQVVVALRKGKILGPQGLGLLIEPGLEDGFDAFLDGRADRKRAAARGLQAVVAVAFAQVQKAQTGTVAMFGMRAVIELPLHDIARGPTCRIERFKVARNVLYSRQNWL